MPCRFHLGMTLTSLCRPLAFLLPGQGAKESSLAVPLILLLISPLVETVG